jgi:hypothetical protein
MKNCGSTSVKSSAQKPPSTVKIMASKNPGFIEKACMQVKYRFFRQKGFLKLVFKKNVHVLGSRSVKLQL